MAGFSSGTHMAGPAFCCMLFALTPVAMLMPVTIAMLSVTMFISIFIAMIVGFVLIITLMFIVIGIYHARIG